MKQVLVILSCMLPLFSHSGGTDEYGGHTDHSTGEYHYHNSSSTSSSSSYDGTSDVYNSFGGELGAGYLFDSGFRFYGAYNWATEAPKIALGWTHLESGWGFQGYWNKSIGVSGHYIFDLEQYQALFDTEIEFGFAFGRGMVSDITDISYDHFLEFNLSINFIIMNHPFLHFGISDAIY